MAMGAILYFEVILILIVLVSSSIIISNQFTIMATQEELIAQVQEVTAVVVKVKAEVSATLVKVSELEAALANAGGVSPELQAAFDELKSQVLVVDSLIPDGEPQPE